MDVAVFQKLAVVADALTDELSDSREAPKKLVERKWPEVVAEVAEAISDNSKLDWAVVFVAASLAELLCEHIGADVAYVRIPNPDVDNQFVLVPIFNWRVDPVGVIPKLKNIQHGPCDRTKTSGGNREESHNQAASASGAYRDEEMQFLRWMKSEAWIPVQLGGMTRALIIFGKGEQDFFDDGTEAISTLRAYEKYVRAFYLLAEQTVDRARKAELLERVATVLPLLFEAESDEAFSRALLTLYTAGTGFAFDRAFLFWLPNGQYPAECRFAVGGKGDEKNQPYKTHRGKQAMVRKDHPNLTDHVRRALDCKTIHSQDTLSNELREKPLFFRTTDVGWLKTFLEGNGACDGNAKRLDHSDPWLQTVREVYKGLLASPFNEYFVLPFAPLGLKNASPLGFLLVDLCYRETSHAPGIDFPDLRMASLVLHLIAAMWQARRDGESYLHVLEVLPVLQHEGPALGMKVAKFTSDLRRQFGEELPKSLDAVTAVTQKLEAAADFVDHMKGKRLRNPVLDLRASVEEFMNHAKHRYQTLNWTAENVELGARVSMPKDTLHSILDCLVQNAVTAAGNTPIRVSIHSKRISLPEGPDRMTERISLIVLNDGPPIEDGISSYLFVSGVSTSGPSHYGTGLSNARRQVKAYGGDLFLCSIDPVAFEVVLEPHNLRSADAAERE